MTGKKRIDMWFVAELAAITLLIIAGLIVPVLNLVALGICAWIIVFERGIDHIFDLLYYLLAISPIFKISLTGFALFNIITILVVARMMLETRFAFIFPNIMPIILLCYVFAGIKSAEMADIIRMVCQTVTVCTLLSLPEMRNSITVKRKNTMLSLGIIVSSAVALMKGSFPRLAGYLSNMATIKLGAGSYYYRFMGVEINANAYTILLSIALAVYLEYLIVGRMNVIDMIIAGTVLLFGCMTVSKSFIVSLVGIAAVAAVEMANRNPKIFAAAVVVGVAGGVAAAAIFGSGDAFRTILHRFAEDFSKGVNLSSMTTGRTDIWMLYFDYFIVNPFVTIFGLGLNAKLPFRPPHNFYIESVAYLGLLGSLIYVMATYAIYAPSRYCKGKCKLYQQLPLIMLLLRGMARCLMCEEKLMFIYLIYTMSAIDTEIAEGTPVPLLRQYARQQG